jgi:hypothetical protein
MVNLISVEEFLPLEIEGKSNYNYKQLTTFVLKDPSLIIEEEEIKKYANNLKEKYPGIKIQEKKIKGKKYFIIQGRLKGKLTPSLYYCYEDKKIYVPKSWKEKKERLTKYIIWRALGFMEKLKIAHVKVIGRI